MNKLQVYLLYIYIKVTQTDFAIKTLKYTNNHNYSYFYIYVSVLLHLYNHLNITGASFFVYCPRNYWYKCRVPVLEREE